MSRILNYGMVGGGPGAFIGHAHRHSVALDESAKLVAGCFSRDHEKCLQQGEQLHLSPDRCYTFYLEMAQKEADREDGIDFVTVVTPNSSHYEICKAFLEAGIHVACDKPVTVSLAQARELRGLAREKGLLFMVTYTYTGHVTAKYVGDLVRSGGIGDVRMVMAEYPQGWLAFPENDGGWRSDPAFSGPVNCLGDLGTHVENIIATMTGLKIRRLLAKMDKKVEGHILDDNDSILVEYDTGASGIYWVSQIAVGSDNSLKVRIYGSRGTVLWEQESPEKVTVIDADKTVREIHRGHACVTAHAAGYTRLPAGHPEGWYEAMANLYHSFTACVNAKKDGTFTDDMIDFPTIEDGAHGLAFVEACLKSTENGNIWIPVEA